MPLSVVVFLCVALVGVSCSSAVSIYFVCKLVDKVAKLAASPDAQTYRAISTVRGPSITIPEAEKDPSGATGNDGTLTDATLTELGKVI